ncbi:MAG TPA: peptidase domain-containing ABC transporter [Burkholderiales bacterium]|jgi:ATP-binding cassette subfamily B protein RaxB
MALLERLQLGFSRELPVLFQVEKGECGLACLAMVASYLGALTDVAELRQRFPVSRKGATLERLIKIATELNLVPRAIRAEVHALSYLRTPCILHWQAAHFVVLKEVSPHHATIHDPALGVRKVPLSELAQLFTGVALELSPNTDFRVQPRREKITFQQMMGRIVGLEQWLLQLGGLAIAIEALTLIGPFFIQWVTDQALVAGDRELLCALMAGFLVLLVIQAAITAVRGWSIMVLTTTFNLQWLGNVFAHLLKLPVIYFEKRHLGDVLTRFNVIAAIQNTLTISFIEAIIDGLMAIGALVMMLIYSKALAVVGVVCVLIYTVLRWLSYGAMRRASRESIVLEARQQTLFMETVRGMPSIRIFNGAEQRVSRWLNLTVDQKNSALRRQRLQLVFSTASSLLFGAAAILVVGLGALAVLDNKAFSIGMLLAFAAYNDQFARRTSGLVDKLFEFKLLEVQIARLADIVLAKEEPNLGSEAALASPEELAPSLEVRHLKYRYDESGPFILEGCSFKVAPGEIVAITGPSGCGKTTLIKAILGLLPVQSGDVLLGGLSYRQLGLGACRDLLGVVMQDDRLFAGSIADNISFFATQPDFALIETCAAQAKVHGEISAMPMRYNTLIGDMGAPLSGGQKQRIFLARALYRRPKIVLLDEATSQLDRDTEVAIVKTIRELGLTCILATHRPEVHGLANRVLELHRGRFMDEEMRRVLASKGQHARPVFARE